MPTLIEILKALSVLAGAAILGNWFLSELRNARRRKLPWYTPYLSPPGLLMLAACILPLLYWLAVK
ncbi:MAG: hypothetical protein MUD16_08655 [Desulfobacterales bacterium]|jgi:hypothetical protein|nr:hypothetical protein [Desulfobacterales bacterium]